MQRSESGRESKLVPMRLCSLKVAKPESLLGSSDRHDSMGKDWETKLVEGRRPRENERLLATVALALVVGPLG